jgi:ribonucleoside-diphosphate reductase alpha chain
MPYIFFKDLANEVNPNNHCGYIPQGNLCMESFSNVMADEETHTCNLVSLNLATLAKTDNLKEATKLAVRILDNTIELTKTPIKTATTHNDKYRTIGVGAMGLHDCLAYEGYSYENSAEEVDNLFELISYWTIEESIKLAGERGAYPAFKGSQWDTGTMIKRYYNQSNSRLSWHKLQEGIDKVGIRNSQLMAVAPNTSSSLLQGCTASVLPCFDIKFFDSAKKGANPVVVPFLRDSQWYYKAYRHMDPLKVTQVIASVSKWVDSGVSYELSFDLNKPEVNAKYAFDVIMDIWRTRKIKTIYYIRYVQKDANSVSKEEASCESCAG